MGDSLPLSIWFLSLRVRKELGSAGVRESTRGRKRRKEKEREREKGSEDERDKCVLTSTAALGTEARGASV